MVRSEVAVGDDDAAFDVEHILVEPEGGRIRVTVVLGLLLMPVTIFDIFECVGGDSEVFECGTDVVVGSIVFPLVLWIGRHPALIFQCVRILPYAALDSRRRCVELAEQVGAFASGFLVCFVAQGSRLYGSW